MCVGGGNATVSTRQNRISGEDAPTHTSNAHASTPFARKRVAKPT
jgi:hypothetical protein